jgi:hypothetical protein
MRPLYQRLAISVGVKRYWAKPESGAHREMLRSHPPKLGYRGGRIPSLPEMTEEQRKVYRKLIRAGIDRGPALAAALSGAPHDQSRA